MTVKYKFGEAKKTAKSKIQKLTVSIDPLKGVVFSKLAAWYDRVEKAGFESFNVVVRSIQSHYLNILNYFENRSTNASAESFNAKIKAFRASFRGVRNVSFFLFRLAKIYA